MLKKIDITLILFALLYGCHQIPEDDIVIPKEDDIIVIQKGIFIDSIFLRSGRCESIQQSIILKGEDTLLNGWVVFDSTGKIDWTSTYYPSIKIEYPKEDSTILKFHLNRSIFRTKIGLYKGELDDYFGYEDTPFYAELVNYKDTITQNLSFDIRKKKYKCTIIDVKDTIDFTGKYFFISLPMIIQ